jgi:glycosyltransferase involved in cell wall biosynthesis
MLYYFPLEPYKARYTCQLSARGKDGWLESKWLDEDIDYMRIEPSMKFKDEDIHGGEVLDGCKRGIWSCYQIIDFLKLVQQNKITSEDIIYFDDFFTPGIEALAYAFHQAKIKPRMYALLHAQSVDEFDFTFNMLPWIRGFEKGIADCLDGIFVSCEFLGNLVYKQGLAPKEKIYVTGLPYNYKKVKEFIQKNILNYDKIPKQRQVIYTSRFDKEKNPYFFMRLAEKYYDIDPTVKFVMTSSHKQIKSNLHEFQQNADFYTSSLSNFEIKTGLSKAEYYEELLKSHVQFNCADQDFVSWTLLEALTCNCIPLYPNFRSFPETFKHIILYDHKNIQNAMSGLTFFLKQTFEEKNKTYNYDSIYNFHDNCWNRMWTIMNQEHYSDFYNLNNFRRAILDEC